MTKTIKSDGQVVRILKQYRNQSNNYREDTKIYGDLYKVKFNDNSTGILCETELN